MGPPTEEKVTTMEFEIDPESFGRKIAPMRRTARVHQGDACFALSAICTQPLLAHLAIRSGRV
jgi:hypothetical protein